MSKSLGNFWTIRDAFEHHAPLALRYALLSVPYRNPIDLTPEFLGDATIHYDRLVEAYGTSLSSDTESDSDLLGASERFAAAMDDDFNTRAAIIEVQRVVSFSAGSDVAVWLEEQAGNILGLLPSSDEVRSGLVQADSTRAEVAERVESLLAEREVARKSSDWGRADEIRDELVSIGVIVEDGPDGPIWRLV
jgi:cysteinyl-tRNA synthetase